tara:strand:+ start:180 stop:512 length:333 start_codon:yes stop_codon:yes gene_type:complete
MKRSIQSNQRSVEILTCIVSADGTAVTGLDKNQVSVADTGTGVKTVTIPAMTSADYSVIVTTATADSVAQVSITNSTTFVVNTFDSTDGTTAKDAVCHILVIGSKIAERV